MRLSPSPRRLRLAARPGFSFPELMVALTVAAVIMAMAYPRTANMREGASLRTAKQSLASYLSTARQAAIRRGTSTTFRRNGNEIWVGGTTASERVSPEIDFEEQYGITLTSSLPLDSVRFNGRGIASPRLGSAVVLRVTLGARTDSICVNTLGMVATCGL